MGKSLEESVKDSYHPLCPMKSATFRSRKCDDCHGLGVYWENRVKKKCSTYNTWLKGRR